MKLVGAGGQQVHHHLYDASGAIVSATLPQLVLGQAMSRSLLFVQNQSNATLWIEIGSARASCTIANGAVNAVTVTNAGFNFTKPPVVRFYGGGRGPDNNTTFLGGNQPGYPAPSNTAQAHAILTTGSVSSIVIDNPGSTYLCAPYVALFNSDLDPYGCATPAAGIGIELVAGQSIMFNETCCPTGPVSIFGGTLALTFCCKWMD